MIKLSEIAEAADGRLCCDDKQITGICTDSRKIKKGELFAAIRGEKFDGHNYIQKAFENGAVCALSEKEAENSIVVKDTRKALGDTAKYYISKFDIPVVGITGSVGKTTVKEMTASILEQKYNVVKTEGNFNNDIGLPLTIFNITKNTQAAVLEMGMNHSGEIEYLSNIAKPDVSVITNVGVSHIENLGSREGILRAKCEIFSGMKKGGIKIINGDDDMLSGLKGDYVRFGMDNKFPFYADNIFEDGLEGISCNIHTPAGGFSVNIPASGRHNVLNALAAAAAGQSLGAKLDDIKKGIENFKNVKMRMDIIRTEKYTIINDIYNSNPVSAKAAIDVLANAEGRRRVCILGDMLELGSFAPSLHRELGEYCLKKKIDETICIGKLGRYIYEGIGKGYYFEKNEDFIKYDKKILQKGDIILLKASRGMKFEEITEYIKR